MSEQRRIAIAVLGDSISAGNPGWDPNPALREREGDNPHSQYEFWAADKDPRLDFRNYGVGGERTDEIAARLEDLVGDAEVLVVQGGINDIVQGRPVEDAAKNLRWMVRRGKELGLAVVIADVLPYNRGWPDAEPKIRELNRLIRELADEESVVVLPFHDTLEDEGLPGRMREDWTADGNHPSVEGHRRLGEIAFRLP
jgi:lysophospholipase L1-like esterase